MNKTLLQTFIYTFSFSLVFGQFISESGDTLYGNEWINYNQEYYKISIAEDGVYRLPISILESAGVSINQIQGANFEMIHHGESYPIYVSNNGVLASGDYIEFYARKNRGEMDKIFYEDPETMQLNPEYSLFTDTAGYFLTWNTSSNNLRVAERTTPQGGNGLPIEAFYMHRERVVLSSRVQKPTRNGSDNVRYSHFDVGEGFGGPLRQKNQVNLGTSKIYQEGPDPSIDITFTTNATVHKIDLLINGDKKAFLEHAGYQLRKEHLEFPLSELKSSNAIRLEGTVDQFDRNIISIADLNYPRSFDFLEANYFEFWMDTESGDKFIEIDKFDGGNAPIVYDPATWSKITPAILDGKYQVIIPKNPIARQLIAVNGDTGVREISSIEKIEFVDYSTQDADFIIVSHPKLMTGNIDQVGAYAAYRSSAVGGSYTTAVVNIEELYEQFSYGIHRHSYSIKNFVNWVAKNWSKPEYIFLLGKGREYGNYRTEEQIIDPVNRSYYLPTYGMPASDNLLVSRGNLSTAHLVSTGRIAAKDVEDVELYLQKVKEHEDFNNKPQTIEDKLWKKRVMHLAGAETALQESIGSYLETMAVNLENSNYGARVTTFRKSSTETIQQADADELLNNIDQGLSVLTFFGHSSVGTFDFNIDDVNKLQNNERYPLVISLGCFSGNVHTISYGISEQYVLTKSKGAIGFIASSSTAYVTPQGNFGIDFYEKLGGDYFGRTIGDVFQSTLAEKDNFTTISSKILNEQMTLHGDPSIKLFNAEQPDYVFDHQSFKTIPSVVESNLDEFELQFKVINLGRFLDDSLSIHLEHYKSDGDTSSVQSFNIKAPEFDTLISLNFMINDPGNVGKNIIKGELDIEDSITEGPEPDAEDNNTLISTDGEEGFAFFSTNNSAVPISPCDFGIYDSEEVVLRASTYNALGSQSVKYILQLDTTALFDSPAMMETSISSFGGLVEWKPEKIFVDNEVYYWRISPDSINEDFGFRWQDASFLYEPTGDNGWNQSHYYQFLDNEYEGLRLDNETRTLQFDTAGFFIKIFNAIWDPNVIGLQFNFESFAASVRPWNVIESGVAVVIGDPKTGIFWTNDGGDYGSVNTSNFGSFRCFAYDMKTEESRQNMLNLITEVAPQESFVYVFTILRNFTADFEPERWLEDEENGLPSFYSVLEGEGAVLSRALVDRGSVPYNFVYRKGLGIITEEIGEEKESFITSTVFVPVKRNNGMTSSPIIGPAKDWGNFILNTGDKDLSDSLQVKVTGIDKDNIERVLFNTELSGNYDFGFVDATAYPFLKFEYYSENANSFIPLPLDSWKVTFTSFPDLTLSNDPSFEFKRDTLQQGEDLEFSLKIDKMDPEGIIGSAKIDITIIDERNQSFIFSDSILLKDSNTATYKFKYNTSDLYGRYKVNVEINKERSIIEKNYFNNFGLREFVVEGDLRNPVLDVSFDGHKILDGDLVSSSPLIEIELRDENKSLLLDDPSLIQVAITNPSGETEILESSDERLKFTPAENGSNNIARLEFRPTFTLDGVYELEVKATDRSNNISGDQILKRSFEIITEQLISNVLNYPNPFSTSTEFIFTLTGDEIPDDIRIQIMTVSGKIVKEIFKEELGDLRIGINRTTYKWDGTDDYGNNLASGVYLFRVNAKNNGEDLDTYHNSNIDRFFKNQLGKLVILR